MSLRTGSIDPGAIKMYPAKAMEIPDANSGVPKPRLSGADTGYKLDGYLEYLHDSGLHKRPPILLAHAARGPWRMNPVQETPVSREKIFLADLGREFSEKPNEAFHFLEILSSRFEDASKLGDPQLIIDYQLLAISLTQAAEVQAATADDIKRLQSLAEVFGIYVPPKRTGMQTGGRGFSYFVKHPIAAGNKLMGADDTQDAPLTVRDANPEDGALARGLSYKQIYYQGDETPIGEMIVIQPSQNVHPSYHVGPMNTDNAVGMNYAVFSSANYYTEYGADDRRVPSTLAIENGQTHNLRVDPKMDGLVVIDNGALKVVNIHDVYLPYVIGGAINNENISMFQASLLVDKGKSLIASNAAGRNDLRRVLVTFNDGSYAIVAINIYIPLKDLGTLLEQIPGIQNAINLDTGGGNCGAYRLEDGSYVKFPLGNMDSLTTIGVTVD